MNKIERLELAGMIERTQDGNIRVFNDHTRRFYDECTEEEFLEKMKELEEDPVQQIINEEVKKEANKIIIDQIKKVSK